MDAMKYNVQRVLSDLLSRRGRSFHCDERSSGTFDWAHYVSILSTASSLEDCEETVDSLLDLLLHNDCEDRVLSMTLIYFIAVYRNCRDLGEEGWEASDVAASFLIRFVKLRASNYGCVSDWRRKKNYAMEFLSALRRSDVKLLKLLVKYGVSVRGVSKECELDEIRRTLQEVSSYAILHLGERPTPDLSLASWRKPYEIYRHLTATVDHTRLMEVLLLGVEAIKRKQSGDATHQEYAECVRIYFRDVPRKFISASEVRFILEKLQFTPLVIESWCRDFSELFPEFPNEPRARSLMDMCRATVRYSLTDKNKQCAKPLPVAVSDLCFPRRLKGYLLGQE